MVRVAEYSDGKRLLSVRVGAFRDAGANDEVVGCDVAAAQYVEVSVKDVSHRIR